MKAQLRRLSQAAEIRSCCLCKNTVREKEERRETEREERKMGFMLRVRLSSFFAGATVASVAGAFFLYKDYKQAQESLYRQVTHVYDTLDERYSALEKRIAELEGPKETLPTPAAPSPDTVI
ncbi:ABC transporter A family protein [Rhynchospora pubera]|uniref:ABC transporter A family protein n=1 Tax=Rhynchospora pubera TaxID=906938 RepID=A0AAV8DZ76_9POAL|nr:ABC transporter A family protein [Rhynchospora pubera]